MTFPDNFKVAAVDVTLLQRTDSSQPYKIKLEVVACIHGGMCFSNRKVKACADLEEWGQGYLDNPKNSNLLNLRCKAT